jgi:hypothetical protein
MLGSGGDLASAYLAFKAILNLNDRLPNVVFGKFT